jgi:hypothetical protein
MNRTLLAPLGLLMVAASPAAAQTAPLPASTLSFAKTEAILGGAPSRFAALMMQQGVVPTTSATMRTPALPAYAAAPRPLTDTPLPEPLPRLALVRRAVSTDRPDVFGSVALSVGQTSLGRGWRAVRGAGVGAASSRFASALQAVPASAAALHVLLRT